MNTFITIGLKLAASLFFFLAVVGLGKEMEAKLRVKDTNTLWYGTKNAEQMKLVAWVCLMGWLVFLIGAIVDIIGVVR